MAAIPSPPAIELAGQIRFAIVAVAGRHCACSSVSLPMIVKGGSRPVAFRSFSIATSFFCSSASTSAWAAVVHHLRASSERA